MAPFPARVHVLLARSAPVGVIIRRGPAREVCTLLWDLRNDTFDLGQWLRGRIYERRCDLSPGGTHLIYFAMNGRWQSAVKGSWTAISRAPYLKALALYPKGDCWHGGGLWTGQRTYWLNDWHGAVPLRETREVRRDEGYTPTGGEGGECLSVYYPRLQRDGWTRLAYAEAAARGLSAIFEKPLPGGWTLRKLAHAELDAPQGKSPYWDEHVLLHPASGATLACPDWEWAERDADRLVWAALGCLMSGRLDASGLRDERVLLDLNPLRFERRIAPY